MRATKWIVRGLSLALVFAGLTGTAFAVDLTPELDPGTMTSALTLISGGLLMLSARRRRS